jgi:hypothetical protein
MFLSIAVDGTNILPLAPHGGMFALFLWAFFFVCLPDVNNAPNRCHV